MMKESLTGLNKAAILLMCLGEEATARVFQELSDKEVKELSKTMATIDHVPDKVKESVFNQYKQSQKQLSGHFFRGNEFAKKAIRATNEGERTNALLEQYVSDTESRSLETISMMNPNMVADLLEKEHPQMVALVLSTQKSKHASNILTLLPEDMQSDVVYRIANLEKVSVGILDDIEDALQREIGKSTETEVKEVGGIDKVIDLLSSLNPNLNGEILNALEETDSKLAEQIRRKIFSFENLIALDGSSLQMILREINNESLALALKTASHELKEKLFDNMSTRAADMIRDDLEALGPVRLSEVEAMQQSIVKIAMKLEEEGKFLLGDNEKHVLV